MRTDDPAMTLLLSVGVAMAGVAVMAAVMALSWLVIR
jgi:hypothetical protein